MKVLVFVPGTMGTQLHNAAGEELWPPKPAETQLGYKRMDKLLADDVTHGDIIQKVLCFDFYGSVFQAFQDLKYLPGDPTQRLIAFPYDWRLDLEGTSQRLAAELDKLNNEPVEEIHLVAHSMGGLITRLVLESGRYADRPWFGKIKTFIALAVPHQGAPLALARVLGLDSAMGISKADFRKFANDRRYPSGYQLLPAPDEAACWDQSLVGLQSPDIYDEAVAKKLGLDQVNLARARFVYDTLRKGAPPKDVRYFFFAGTGHETVTRVNVFDDGSNTYPLDQMVVTRTEGAGDGTVPLWSALPRPVQKQVVVNEHSHVFTGTPFKKVFYRLLGGDLGPALENLLEEQAPDPLRLSVPHPVIECNKDFELLVIPPPSESVSAIDGTLWIQKLHDDGALEGPRQPLATVQYNGPPVSTLRLAMPPLAQPGWYQLTFTGAPMDSPPIQFAAARL
jgi:pimeloyl-ACP methyl ester carboxylesterase